MLDRFHPAVRTWFTRRFPDGRPRRGSEDGRRSPTADTLICAPTGAGKTLARFLTAIDALYQARDA